MIIKKLTGHSGCNLFLYNEKGITFVRKVSPATSYNTRLKKQYIKQYKFLNKTVSTPEVLNTGYTGECFYFDMTYVSGRTLAEFMSFIPILDIVSFTKTLFEALHCRDNKTTKTTPDIFGKKIADLKTKTQHIPKCKQAIEYLEKVDWSCVEYSPCHGDLTLENIIVTNDKGLFLIDFLDSFYNSWMIDVAKLLQDLELGWSYRNETADTNRSFRLHVAREVLLEQLQKLPNSNCAILTIYNLLLLNLVRIYPYTQDQHTLDFLDQSTEHVMSQLANNNYGS